MKGERIGAGAIAALVFATSIFLLQSAVLLFALSQGAFGFTIFIPLVLSLPVSLAQALVVTPLWCVWLLARSDRAGTRRHRLITLSLALSGVTVCSTLWTWYLVYTAPHVNLHIMNG